MSTTPVGMGKGKVRKDASQTEQTQAASVKIEADNEASVSTQGVTISKLGISVHHLATVLRERCTATFAAAASAGTLRNSSDEPISVAAGTMWHFVQLYVKPVTRNVGASYVQHIQNMYTRLYDFREKMEDHPEDHCGKASFLLSHAMQYSVKDVVEALECWCRTRDLSFKRTYVWLCELCVDQHQRQPNLDEVKLVVESIPTVLPLMIPWMQPVYVKRLWCLCEYSLAVRYGCRVEVLLTPNDRNALIGLFSQSHAAFDTIQHVLTNIATKGATTATEACREELQKYLDTMVGNHQLDRNLRGSFEHLLFSMSMQCKK
eukprot:m.16965 g.16965  ORF g.16965 m.16965 type:complete len:319 (-) comp11115_c0_seq2:34-990(-)